MDQIKRVILRYGIYLVALALYVPFIFMGYGSDSDTYSVLWSGEKFARTFDYIPSRPPGFLVFEIIVFFLNRLGGPVLTNLFVLSMFLVFLYCFNQVAHSYNVPHARIISLAIIAHPIVWVEATSTMDFYLALGLVWLGFLLLLKNRWWGAGLAMGLGIGSRATSVLMVGLILLFLFITTPKSRRLAFGAGFIAVLVATVCYLPSLDFSKWTLNFLRPAVGGEEYWTTYLRMGRWIYKSIFFWGIPVWLVFIYGLWRGVKQRTLWWNHPNRPLFIFCVAGIIVYELFYISIPTEPAYLLPTIPLWLILMAYLYERQKAGIWLIAGLLFIMNFINLNIARPNDKNHATSVQYGVWLETGHLVVETDERLRYVECGYRMCPEDLLPAPEVRKKK